MKGLVNSTFVSIFHLASMKNCHQNIFLLESFNNEWNSQMNPNFCFVQQIYRIHAFQAVYHSKSGLFLGHLLVAVCSIEKVAFALHATFSVIMTAYTHRVAINPAEICTNRRKKRWKCRNSIACSTYVCSTACICRHMFAELTYEQNIRINKIISAWDLVLHLIWLSLQLRFFNCVHMELFAVCRRDTQS